jgi:hypothetical protein
MTQSPPTASHSPLVEIEGSKAGPVILLGALGSLRPEILELWTQHSALSTHKPSFTFHHSLFLIPIQELSRTFLLSLVRRNEPAS